MLWLSTKDAQKEMEKLGKYIRKDLIEDTMKPFYDEVSKLPTVLRDSFDAAKPEFEKLGEALRPMMEDLNKALPGIIKQVAKLFTSVAEAARPFFKAMLDGLPDLIKGIKGFFDAFKDNGDPTVIKKVFRDIGQAIKALGEFLADLDGDDYEKFKTVIIEASKGIVNAVKTVNSIIEKVDEILRKFGTNIYEVAGFALVLGAAMRVFGPLLKVFNAGWQIFNKMNLVSTLRGLTGGVSNLAGWIPKIAKIGGVATVITAAFFGWKWVIDEINTEGSKLNQWWKDLTESDAWNYMVGAFNEFKNAITEGLAELKTIWDEVWGELEASGTIEDLKEVASTVGDILLPLLGGAFKSTLQTVGMTFKVAAGGTHLFIEAIKFAYEGVKQFVDIMSDTFRQFKQTVGNVWDAVSDAVKSAWDKMKEIFNSVKDKIEPVIEAFRNVRDKVKDIQDAIRDKVREIWDSIRDKVREINDGIRDKVREIWDGVRDKVREINDAIRDKVREIWDGLRDKVREINDAIREKVREVWDAIREKVREINDAIRDKIADIWTTIKDTIGEKVGNALETVRNKLGEMVESAKNKAQDMLNAGTNLIMGLVRGIINAGPKAVAAIANIAITVVNKAKQIFRIGSPSKVFAGYGQNIGQGLVIGLDKSEKPVSKAVDSLAAVVTMDNAPLSNIWEQEVIAAQKATDQLRKIWGTWAKDYMSTINATRTDAYALSVPSGTVEHRTYNLTVYSNSPNAGREIVQEIQKYERVNGRSWRS